MKLWRATVKTSHLGIRYLWAPSKIRTRSLVRACYPGCEYSMEQREVPTGKEALLTFLNTYAYQP